MDNIFVLFKFAEHLTKFRDYFNTCHQNMSLSFEQGKDGKLSFLDIQVSRQEGHFVTAIYRKPNFSGIYMHFESFLSTIYEFGMTYTLVYRYFRPLELLPIKSLNF